jgi:hypothetical protein
MGEFCKKRTNLSLINPSVMLQSNQMKNQQSNQMKNQQSNQMKNQQSNLQGVQQ